MLFIKYILIFIVFATNNISLETIKICNQKNENLEFAYVLNLSNDNWSITDHNGLAPLPINTKLNDFFDNDEVVFYKNIKDLLNSFARFLTSEAEVG